MSKKMPSQKIFNPILTISNTLQNFFNIRMGTLLNCLFGRFQVWLSFTLGYKEAISDYFFLDINKDLSLQKKLDTRQMFILLA